MYILHWLVESPKRMIWALVHFAFVYALIYYFLVCIKTDVNLAQSALYLLILSILAMLSCPLTNKLFMHITGRCDKNEMGARSSYDQHTR